VRDAAPTWPKHRNVELFVPKKADAFANLRKLHHKLMVIDERIVLAGSFNYTEPANAFNDEDIFVVGSTHAEVEGIEVEADRRASLLAISSRRSSGSSRSASDGRRARHVPCIFHCHVLQHGDRGMTGQYVVVEPGQRARPVQSGECRAGSPRGVWRSRRPSQPFASLAPVRPDSSSLLATDVA
jgi:hypothetical protein